MTLEIFIESFIAVTVLALLISAYVLGKKNQLNREKGWSLILTGLALLAFGSIIDLSDNFPWLSRFVLLGNTPAQVILEKIFGQLFGLVIFLLGLRQWMPTLTERRRLEMQLKRSSVLYQSVLENSPGYIFLLDSHGQIVELGGPETGQRSARKKNVFSHVAESSWDRFQQAIDICIRTGNQQEFEVPSADKARIFQVLLAPIRSDSAKTAHLACNMFDITWRKESEASLQESEQRFAGILNIAKEAIVSLDDKGRIILFNKGAEAVFGYSASEVMGQPVHMLMPEQFRESHEGHLVDFKKSNQVSREMGETRQIFGQRKDGSRFPVESSISKLETNGQTILTAVLRDLSERRAAEEALESEKERLAITLSSITDGVITADIEGKIFLINSVASNLTGWPESDALGKPITEVFRGLCKGENFDVPIEQLLAGTLETMHENDCTLITREGDRLPIAGSATAMKNRAGDRQGVVVAFRDLSQERKLEAELLQAQKLESLGVLAGGLAHDFNNFLMAIMLNVATAKIKSADFPDTVKLLDAAEGAITKAKGITQQLLTFTRGGDPVTEVTDLGPIIKEAVTFSLHGSNILPSFEIAEDLWPVNIDSGQMTQVIQNLTINALNAMPHGGSLSVQALNVKIDDHNIVQGLELGEFIEVRITDTGTGIPADILNSIFDPYFTTRETGSGLGLFSSYSILSKHSGAITVESVVKEGTTFTFYLPAKIEATPKEKDTELAPGSGRILVMDDDETIQMGLEFFLMELGYEVKSTEDGAAAVGEYRLNFESGNRYNAVILDLTIPGGMGGVEALRQLMKIDPDVTAIVSSGYANDPIMSEYRKYGFKGVLMKPFNPAELAQCLKEALLVDSDG